MMLMRIKSRISVVALMVVFILGMAFGQSLQSVPQQKLHPVFQALLAGDLATVNSNAGGIAARSVGLAKDGANLYDAIITTTNADVVRASGVSLNSVVGNYATARVTRQDLLKLIQLNEVVYVDPGAVDHPALDLSVPETGANLLQNGFLNNVPYRGKGVIVLIHDTGIDWRQLDFRDPVDTTKSRILAIWDQTISASSGETPPAGFSYGVEYTKQQIEAELRANPPNVVREKDINGHGTNVTGIAAGNGNSYFKKYVGMAPEADIIVVKGGDGSFSETGEIDALTYAGYKSATLVEPIVVNMSLGGQSGPHDGTRPSELAVNNFVKTAGRAVSISAGNDGDEVIHITGSLAVGGTASVSVNVPAYTPTTGTNNDKFQLEIWFNSNINVNASVQSPSGIVYAMNSGSSGTSSNSTDGTITLYNSSAGSPNGNRYVELVVNDQTTNVPKSGVWTLTLSGASLSAGFDGWLSSYAVGNTVATVVNGNTSKTVEAPGTADGAITVASYVTKNGWLAIDGNNYVYTNNPALASISSFSSIGPSSDGRQKPEIAAPGQGIGSSLSGFVDASSLSTWVLSGGKDILMQGTSQAAPHVTGAAALLFQISKGLTAAQVKSLLTSTAATDASTGSVPNMTWGYGKMDILRAAVKAINPLATVQKQTLTYDVDGTNQISGAPFLTGSTKYAVRFTPSISGQLTGMQVNITTAANRPIQGAGPLVCEVWSNTPGSVNGVPGTKLGNTVLQAFQRLSPGTNNFIDMTTANVSVSAGQEYHLVIAVANPTDTVKVRADQSTYAVPTGRSSYYNGTRWYNVTETGSALVPQNIRIRAMITSLSGLVSVESQDLVPQKFELAQNYPNPFNPTTTIRYAVPAQGRVRLRVFDLIGREVASLVDAEAAPGSYTINWRGTDNKGVPLSSGVYFYTLEGSGQQITKKMILLK
jgi:minor extracellular serine protease Vpr